jgi:tetratricopeptide (TPR) repeat protein
MAAVCVIVMAAALSGAPAEARPRRDQAYYHYLLSRQALDERDFPGAVREMERAREADPRSMELSLDLARLHLELGDAARAAEEARVAAELKPADPAPVRLLSEALFHLAMREGADDAALEAARASLQELQRLEPGDAGIPLDQARLLLSRGRDQEALAAIEKNRELDPGSEEGALLGAQALSHLGRFEDAHRLLMAAIDANPRQPALRVALMDVYESQGRLEDAAAVGTRLLDAGFEPMRMRYQLARLSQKQGNHDAAYGHLSALSGLMELHPDRFAAAERAEIALRAVGALVEAGRLPEAAAAAESGARRHPGDVRFLLRHGEALLLQGKVREAESLFAQAPSGGDTQARLSELYLAAGARRERGGSVREAEQYLRRAIEIAPKNASALNYLGYMLADRGERLDEAEALTRRALEVEPDNGAFLDSLGWALYRKGDFAQAEQMLLRARAALEEEAEIHEHLGDLYFATGRVQEAIASWSRALELGSDHADRLRKRISEARQGPGTED